MTALMSIALGALGGSCAYAVGAILEYTRTQKPQPAEPAELTEPTELDALVQQERWKQATPVAIAAAMQWPVDVKVLTLIFHYEDGHSLQMQCGKPEQMEVEP